MDLENPTLRRRDRHLARKRKLLSSDHFTVDATLIDARTSFKSFKRKDCTPPTDGDDGTGMVDFKGKKRSNATRQGTTAPESRLHMRKGNNQPATLSYGGHVLTENRNGLCLDIRMTASPQTEHRATRQLLTRARGRHLQPKTGPRWPGSGMKQPHEASLGQPATERLSPNTAGYGDDRYCSTHVTDCRAA